MDGNADNVAEGQRPDLLRLRIMLRVLNCAFGTTQTPTREQRQRLAACLGMSEVKVRKWFERKRMEEVLAMHSAGCSKPRVQATEKYIDLQSVAGDDMRVITAATPPYQILGACETWQRFCGFRLSELVGKTLSIVQGPQTDMDTIVALMDAVERHDPITATLINYTKNGIPFRHTVDISPLPGGAGFLCVSSDVVTLLDQGVMRRAMSSPSLSLDTSSAASPLADSSEHLPDAQVFQLPEQTHTEQLPEQTHTAAIP